MRLPYSFRRRLSRFLDPWPYVTANVLHVRSLEYMKVAMAWDRDPIVIGNHLHEYEYPADLNDRRVRDAEVVATACRNSDKRIILEIGTGLGRTTALMAMNAPESDIYTVNIPPDEIEAGGKFTTFAPTMSEIGRYYREQGADNVEQIYANTTSWEPGFSPIGVALIDGSHDAEFVYNDTCKILSKCDPGSIILWHDFSPEDTHKYQWIADVCRGIDMLYAAKKLGGPIYHLQDSWIGLYRVPE